MKTSKNASLREKFTDDIQHKILSGELEIGSKLPTERQLTVEYGVSRQVINSGIAELQRRGFVRVAPRHGTYVADFRLTGDMNTLNAVMDYHGDDLREEEIKSILEVRWGIEHLTLKNAIDNASDQDLEKLGQIVEKIKFAESPEAAAELAHSYQHTMAMMGGNTVLPLIISSFKPSTDTMWIRFVKLYGVETLYSNTSKAYSFVRSRDFQGAVDWLTRVLKDVIDGEHQIYKSI